jgi:ABC-type transport system involved in multi-copper enzyme maturation permease subunit
MLNQLVKFIAKDFIIQKKSLKTYIILGAAMALMFSFTSRDNHSMVVAVVAFPVIYGFLNKALYEDEKNNTLRFLAALPMKREIIVYGRYISVVLMSIIVALVLYVLNYILVMAGIWKSAAGADGLIILATIFVFMIMVSVYLPLAFKLGYIKAAGINRFIFIGLIALCGAVGVAAGSLLKGEPPEFIGRLDEFLSSISVGTAVLLSGIAVLAIYLLSMRISVYVFKKRDLFS